MSSSNFVVPTETNIYCVSFIFFNLNYRYKMLLSYNLYQNKSSMKLLALAFGTLAFVNSFQIKQNEQDSLTTPEECVAQKCPKQWDACQKDSKCIPTIQKCEKKCGSKESCWKLCLVEAGDTDAENVAKCAAAQGCLSQNVEEVEEIPSTALMTVDPEECVAQKCPKQWDACQKDSKCIPTIQKCEKKCGTGKTCWEFCLSGAGDQKAIDVAKCASAQKCLGLTQEVFMYPFEKCVSGKCTIPFVECEKDEMCSFYMDKCTVNGQKYNFDFECMVESSSFSPKFQRMFDCVGYNKCI